MLAGSSLTAAFRALVAGLFVFASAANAQSGQIALKKIVS